MAFIRIKTIKDVKYYYLVQSIREDGKVKQKIVQYFGTTLPDGYVVPTKASYSVVTRKAVKKAGTTKTMGKVVPSVLPQTVSTTPPQTNLSLTRGRGGNRHPIAVKQFIVDRLARVGEDYISGMHQAYKDALDQLAWERRFVRVYKYHHPVYFSFSKKVWELITEGSVEFSGREEASDDRRFVGWKYKPIRKYVRLVKAR